MHINCEIKTNIMHVNLLDELPFAEEADLDAEEEDLFACFPFVSVSKAWSPAMGVVYALSNAPGVNPCQVAPGESACDAAKAVVGRTGGVSFSRELEDGQSVHFVLQGAEASTIFSWLFGGLAPGSELRLCIEPDGGVSLRRAKGAPAVGLPANFLEDLPADFFDDLPEEGTEAAGQRRGTDGGTEEQGAGERGTEQAAGVQVAGDQAAGEILERALALLRGSTSVRGELERAGDELGVHLRLEPSRVLQARTEPDGSLAFELEVEARPNSRLELQIWNFSLQARLSDGGGGAKTKAYATDLRRGISLDTALPSLLLALRSVGHAPFAVREVDERYLSPELLESTFGELRPDPGALRRIDVICSGLNTGKTKALIEAYVRPALELKRKILVLTCRRAFSRDLKRRLDEASLPSVAVLYSDVWRPKDPQSAHGTWGFRDPRIQVVICTIDSAHKVQDDWQGLEDLGEGGGGGLLVVLDELSSLMRHFTLSSTLEPVAGGLGARSLPRNLRCARLWRGIEGAQEIVALDGYVRPTDLAFLGKSAASTGARLALLFNHRRTCDWRIRLSDSPTAVERDLMSRCRPGGLRAMIIVETTGRAQALASALKKQATEILERDPACAPGPFTIGIVIGQAKDKQFDYSDDGRARVKKLDLAEEGGYKTCDAVIATSALGAGVDFSDAHFDKIYGIFDAKMPLLEADDIVQLLFRVRRLRGQGEGTGVKGGEHLLLSVRRCSVTPVRASDAARHWRESGGGPGGRGHPTEAPAVETYLDLKAEHNGDRRASMPSRHLSVAARLRQLSVGPSENLWTTADQGKPSARKEQERQKMEIDWVHKAALMDVPQILALAESWDGSLEGTAFETVLSLARQSIADFMVLDPATLTAGDVEWMWESRYSLGLKAKASLVLLDGHSIEGIEPSSDRLYLSKLVAVFRAIGWTGEGDRAKDVLWVDELCRGLTSEQGRAAYRELQSVDPKCPRFDPAKYKSVKAIAMQARRVARYLFETCRGVRKISSVRDGGAMQNRKRKYLACVEDTMSDVLGRQAGSAAQTSVLHYADAYRVFVKCYDLVRLRSEVALGSEVALAGTVRTSAMEVGK